MKKINLTKVFFKKISKNRLKNEHFEIFLPVFFYFLKSFCRNKKICKKFLATLSSNFFEFEIKYSLLGKEILFISITFLPGIIGTDKISKLKNKQDVSFFNQKATKKKLILFWTFFFQILNKEKIEKLKRFFLIIGKKVFSLGFSNILFLIFSPRITLTFLKQYQSLNTTAHSLAFLQLFYLGLKDHQRIKFLGEILKLGKFSKGDVIDNLFYRFFLSFFCQISKEKTIVISEKLYISFKKSFHRKLYKIPNVVNLVSIKVLKFLLVILTGNFPKKMNFLYNLKIFSFLEDFLKITGKKRFLFQNLETFLNFSGHLSKHNSKHNNGFLFMLIRNFLKKQKTEFFETLTLTKASFIKMEKMFFFKNQKFLIGCQVKNWILFKNLIKKFNQRKKLNTEGKIKIRFSNLKFFPFLGSSLRNFF